MQRSIPFLWGIVIIILILNFFLLDALNLARLTAINTLTNVEAMLDRLANEVIVYNIEINQAVPVKVDVPFNRTMEIPLNTVIPVDQELSVPFQMGGTEIQLDVPIQGDFPIDIVVPVDFNETITVDTVVQLETTLPVEIDIAQTPLTAYFQQARQDIGRLRSKLAFQGEMATVPAAITQDESPVESGPAAAANSRSPQEALADTGTTLGTPRVEVAAATGLEIATPISVDDALPQTAEPGPCEHRYWPLLPGTTWTFNSAETSYSQQIDNISNNQIHFNTMYEGQGIEFYLSCDQDGLGGNYPGDMRRMTEFGRLNFNNARGTFLPGPEMMEQIGRSWTQEIDITGSVEGRQGNQPVTGNINRGRIAAVYTPTGFETLETPLGPREALRIEQKLDLELDIDFDLGNQSIPAGETVTLTTIYWFVEGLGPVKIHWQGGTIQQNFAIKPIPMSQQFTVPALAEEQLVTVCVLTAEDSSECMQMAGTVPLSLTNPPDSELDIQPFVLPDNIGMDDNAIPSEATDPLGKTEKDADERSDRSSETGRDSRTALLAYATATAGLGERISNAGESFASAAIAYRNGDLTLDEFQDEFSSFAPEVKALIQEIDRLSPPPEAESIHQKLTDGLGQCDTAVDLMNEWFDTSDSGTKEETVLLVAGCMEQVTQAEDELAALVEEN